MFRIKIILVLIFLICSISGYSAEDQGFNEVCRIYTEAKNSNMSAGVASKYIFNNVKERVSSVDALQAHAAVMQAMGDKRYSLFKESAEHVLKRSWNCDAMKLMMGMKVK